MLKLTLPTEMLMELFHKKQVFLSEKSVNNNKQLKEAFKNRLPVLVTAYLYEQPVMIQKCVSIDKVGTISYLLVSYTNNRKDAITAAKQNREIRKRKSIQDQ